ncbi:hypothetical protein HYH02_011895 [Chlamydomonas schloesseri]|uniref:Malic enzyme n=1 Tax=Chlamydomonas schloesseri TaxID=2026947 RepID=A0A835T881_9CHLO|nr:hypothetical protein HYH02_011895 [Chlamydomonas schloesseri]|eukprot:KAG2435604.1 hypothetical protein HYH02_011895 [Chlamydomonas schloesseri]
MLPALASRLGRWNGAMHAALPAATQGLGFHVNSSGNPTNYEEEEEVPPYSPALQHPAYVVRKTGVDILHDPWCNKGSAFPKSERDRLGLRGLLPPRSLTMELQAARFMEDYYQPRELIPPEDVKLGGVTSAMARRWKLLQELQDRNETLFYRVLVDNFTEMAPIIYTPTVGWVCVNYHKLYRRPRGMYFSAADRGDMLAMAYNWPQQDVQAIVVTDGSRILGLGDLGVNGLGIPIGKLDLYCAAAGFSPSKVLPVVIDVGTNNEALRNDPHYVGLRIPRITGPEYFAIIDEFVSAVMARWPSAVLQFEDFSINHAVPLLERYRKHHLVFNDDIQGTAATALAGLYGALRVMGLPPAALGQQRIVCVGAGSAGMGVVKMIASGMEKQQGLSPKQAADRFHVIDAHGLITSARTGIADFARPFARTDPTHEGEDLLSVVKRVKPTILLGLAGAGRLFTEEVLEAMNKGCPSQRPIIFPMSNPTSRMECTAEDAMRVTQGRAIFASGSPQPPVTLASGRQVAVSQCNNMYIFPGIALGAYLGQTRIITDRMLMAAAEELPRLIPQEELERGLVYPKLSKIRDISVSIATAVANAAGDEGRLRGRMREKYAQGDEALRAYIASSMFYPNYSALVHVPHGIGE